MAYCLYIGGASLKTWMKNNNMGQSAAKKAGRAGEDYTALWLENHGYSIVERNYHSRYGEIDIIVRDSQYIVFVEVKTRASGSMVPGAAAVTPSKQQKLLLTAQTYLMKSQCALQPRFDVAAVTTLHGEPMGLQYFENAFGC